MMKKTFACDESMIITIPIGNTRELQDNQGMPDHFFCAFKDSFKVLVIKGKVQRLGAAQAAIGLFLLALGFGIRNDFIQILTIPSIVYVISGILCYAAGKYPNMTLAKLSFSIIIISLLWSLAELFLMWGISNPSSHSDLTNGITGIITALLVIESIIALFLINGFSKAICKQHFTTLPIILLKRED